jgi:hypothetical protein
MVESMNLSSVLKMVWSSFQDSFLIFIVEFVLRSKNGRRKSMLGKTVVYLVSSESDVDSDQETDNVKKSSKNRKPTNRDKSSSGTDYFAMLN